MASSSSSSKISFGFKAKPSVATQAKAIPNKSAQFGDDDDEDEQDLAPTAGSNTRPASKATQHHTTQALSLDSKIYDYDGVYDSLKSHEKQRKAAREVERSKRDPKYIEGMLDSVKERNKLLLRAQAKKTQREREEEGDEYEGGEEFVTDAYREQMEEMKRVEEEEKREEEMQGMKRGGANLSGFYKNVMEEREALHTAAVRAAEGGDSTPPVDSTPSSSTATPTPRHPTAQTNDEGELIDQRSILSAGLNVLKSRDTTTTPRPSAHSIRKTPHDGAARSSHSARERSSRAVEDQILEMEQRREGERMKEEEERKRKIIGERRNDESKIEEARRRMEERKRRRVGGA